MQYPPNTPSSHSQSMSLIPYQKLKVRQLHEPGEWLGFETRNKFNITDENGQQVAFAAEQQKGMFGFLLRQYLGHWRKFDIVFFTPTRETFMVAHHPFRWFFQRLELRNSSGQLIGALQKRFSILTKRFDVENAQGMPIMEVASPIWKIWTFAFMRRDRQIASVSKKWSGLFTEMITDKDNFMVEYNDANLTEDERKLVMAASIFIDLLYFEKKQ